MNTFLHGDLEQDVYMSVSCGYQINNHPDIVCKLKKPCIDLYNLQDHSWKVYLSYERLWSQAEK